MRVSVKRPVGLKREEKRENSGSQELNIHPRKPSVAEWCRESNRIFEASSETEKDSQ